MSEKHTFMSESTKVFWLFTSSLYIDANLLQSCCPLYTACSFDAECPSPLASALCPQRNYERLKASPEVDCHSEVCDGLIGRR